jgi:tRNA-dihydrouridine synthase B
MTRFEKLGISFPFFIAPMVGISHVAFREWIRAYTPPSLFPLLFTEMISSRRLPSEQLGEADHLITAVGENGLVPQLLCNEESYIADSLTKLSGLHPWGIDINMGCPVTQTLKHNWGVQLMHDKDKAAEVVRFAKKYAHRPISVKLRAALGREFDIDYLLSFTRALEEAGADWLTVHCRTQKQGHHGYARWDMVEAVARERSIPVVANGDIHTWKDAVEVRERFRVDGVMIARAATARPWILWQIGFHLGVRDKPLAVHLDRPPLTPEEEGAEYFSALARFSCLLETYYGDSPRALKKLFFLLSLSSRWLFYGHGFLTQARKCQSLFEFRDFIHTYRGECPQPLIQTART